MNGDGSYTGDTTGDGLVDTWDLSWKVERLSNGVIQLYDGPGCKDPNSSGQASNTYLSNAQTHFNHGLGNLIMHNGNSKNNYGSRLTTSQNWLRSRYTEGGGVSSEEISYVQHLEEPKTIEFKRDCQTISQLDFHFRNNLGEKIRPTRGVLKLNFKIPRN